MAHDFVTTGQIAAELGVSRQWIIKIIDGADGFPEPDVVLPNGTRLWRRGPALKWFEENPRKPRGRPRKAL